MSWTNTITTLILHKRKMTLSSLSGSSPILSPFQMEVFAVLKRGDGAQAMNPDPPVAPRQTCCTMCCGESWLCLSCNGLEGGPITSSFHRPDLLKLHGTWMSYQTQPEPSNGPWATSLNQGGHHICLGHPESSNDVSILTRRRVLTW